MGSPLKWLCGPLQRQGQWSDQCSWLLLTTAEYFLQRGSATLCCLLDVSKGFDRVKFFTLFSTLLTKVPAIVVRVLVFTYTEQSGFVCLASGRSSSFGLSNGTRQGAAASPALWAVYVDGLLSELERDRGLAATWQSLWMGAYMYVDDLTLLAPTRAVMAEMLEVVECYSVSHNLKLSTDPNPTTQQSVSTLWGLGAEWCGLPHCSCMGRSCELRAVQILCCDAYGSPLWRLNSPASTSFFKAWSSCVRRVYRLPVTTFTYLVEGHLAKDFTPMRNMVLGRYLGFYW